MHFTSSLAARDMCAGSPLGPVPDRKPSRDKGAKSECETNYQNAMSIDLEDWFCVNNLSHVIRERIGITAS